MKSVVDFSANSEVMNDSAFAHLLSVLTATIASKPQASTLHINVSRCTKLTRASLEIVNSFNATHANLHESSVLVDFSVSQ